MRFLHLILKLVCICIPESQVHNHEYHKTPSCSLLDRKSLIVQEISYHESTGDIPPRNQKRTKGTRADVHVLGLQRANIATVEPRGEEQRAEEENLWWKLRTTTRIELMYTHITRRDDFEPFEHGLRPSSLSERDLDTVLSLHLLRMG